MKPKTFFILIWNLLICLPSGNLLFSQNIINTLGTNGFFKIKGENGEYLTVSMSNGFLSLNRSFVLPNTTGSNLGVIYKNANRFIHTYHTTEDIGYNTFMGINAGNFSLLAQARNNTGVGPHTLSYLTTGSQNTALGSGSLQYNFTGSQNTAVGYLSLNNNISGNFNTSVGSRSLFSNSTGIRNTSLGCETLHENTTGNDNTALGNGSLYSNTTGNYNTAVGYNSSYYNATGSENTAIGYQSLFNNTDNSGNTAVGYNTLFYSTGWQNTAVGHHSLNSSTTGNFNTAIGYNSGSLVTTGYNLTLVGIDANPSSPTANDQITLGNQFVSSLRCNVQSITSLSDARDKKNIQELSLGLDFITKLHPREFNWDKREWYDENVSDGSKMKESPTAGFIAQELDEIQQSAGAEWLNLVLKDNPEKWEATYGNLLPVMVKAIQELKTENDVLKAEIEQLRSIEERLTSLELRQTEQSRTKEIKMSGE